MKNLRFLTPILVTLSLSMLSYIVYELNATKAYADKLMEKHELRPHIITETRLNALAKEINELTIEVRLLRYEIKKKNDRR